LPPGASKPIRGQGTFIDPRLDDATRFPIAARERFGHVRAEEDLITPLLPALQIYQLALPAPTPPRGSYDRSAAKRGARVFGGKANCAACHVPPLFTNPAGTCTPERDRHRRSVRRSGQPLPSASRTGHTPAASITTDRRYASKVIDHWTHISR
jgi:hypothetical protein